MSEADFWKLTLKKAYGLIKYEHELNKERENRKPVNKLYKIDELEP